MQTRPYSDLFKLIQSLAGVTAFADNEKDDIINLINRRFKVAYDTSNMWPRYLVTSDERDVGDFVVKGFAARTNDNSPNIRGSYQNIGKDSNGNNVYVNMDDDASTVVGFTRNDVGLQKAWQFIYFLNTPTIDPTTKIVTWATAPTSAIALQDRDKDPTVYDSPVDVIAWKPGSGTSTTVYPDIEKRYIIPWESTFFYSNKVSGLGGGGKTERPSIAEFVRIHRKDAFYKNSSSEYDFYIDEFGANLINPIANENKAHVTFRSPFEPFTVEVADVLTSTAKVPDEFFSYIAYGTYADFLRMDGQHDKAQLEQENANLTLASELEKVDVIMNNNTVNQRFSTYVNRQSR